MNINGQTEVLGIIGNPVRHTLSPLIHNMLSELMERNIVYLPFEVKQNLKDAVKGAYELGITGMNVTVPYKTDVIPYLVETEELAEQIGAVNTLVRTQTGYAGYNTDIIGLLRELESEKVPLLGQHVVILGAGGAARATAFLCAKKKAASIVLLNRTIEKAEAIVCDVQNFLDKAINGSDTVITARPLEQYNMLNERTYIAFQCTQLGLYPQTDAVVIEDEQFYQKIMCGIDLIYNPAETKFMKLVKKAGKRAYNGLKMLLYQAVSAYEYWNDLKVPEEIIEKVYKQLLVELGQVGEMDD